MKQTNFQKENHQQTNWETWFIMSCVFFGGIFFIWTLKGSEDIKELPYLGTIAITNLVICIYKGTKTKS
jgi:hypothetical protein